MRAYKLKGKVDEAGNLALAEPVKMLPGDVEIIVLQAVATADNDMPATNEVREAKLKGRNSCKVEAFRDLFENTEPAPADFDPDRARWEALKEKYNL